MCGSKGVTNIFPGVRFFCRRTRGRKCQFAVISVTTAVLFFCRGIYLSGGKCRGANGAAVQIFVISVTTAAVSFTVKFIRQSANSKA